jgi:sugar lactone lactonase YvrE
MGTFLKSMLVGLALGLTACTLDVSVLGKTTLSQPSIANSNEVNGIFPLGVEPYAKMSSSNLANSFAFMPDKTLVLTDFFNSTCPISFTATDGTLQKCLVTGYSGQATADMKIDAQGNMYMVLAEIDNSVTPPVNVMQIRKYNSTGNLLYTIGSDESAGQFLFSTTGKFLRLGDIALDTNNTFLVAADLCSVMRFSAAGSYISEFGTCGSGQGQFGQIMSLAIDSNRNIFVLESSGRVQKFNSSGTWLKEFNQNGSGPHEYSSSIKIAVDSAGYVYILDGSSGKLLKYDEDGVYQWKFDGSATAYTLNNPNDISIEADGNIYVNDPNNKVIHVLQTDSTYVKIYKKGTATFSMPIGIALDNDGHFLVGQATGDIVKVDGYGNNILTISTSSKIALAIVADSDSNIYTLLTADLMNYTLKKYDPDGVEDTTFAAGLITSISGNPTAISIDSNDVLYVADTGASSSVIKKISIKTGLQDGSDLGTGLLTAPMTMSVSPDGSSIALIDGTTLKRLNASGANHAQQYNTAGTGSVGASYGLWQDKDGNLYVADTSGTKEIVKFNKAGSPVGRYGQAGMAYDLVLTGPYGVTGDNEGNFYVADALSNNLQKFNSSGVQQRQ